MYSLALYIFRRDLRIQHNAALYNAIKNSKKVLPIYIFTPAQISNTKNPYKSDMSVQFMIESLSDLQENISKHSGKLFTFYGENQIIITYLIKKYGIDAIYVNKDYTPYSKSRDAKIESICKQANIAFHTYDDVCIFNPQTITTANGVYKKFTPFYNECLRQFNRIEFIPSVTFTSKWYVDVSDAKYIVSLKDSYVSYTTPSETALVSGGRQNAFTILNRISAFKQYEKTRNQLSTPTTQLSAYLKYGCVSSKEVLSTLLKQKFNRTHSLIRQLIWRDFYIHILDAYPMVLKGKSFKPTYDSIKWNHNTSWFNAWKDGKTGFPIVDACMRQLNISGYMHNRGRLIVSSFLIKTLFIDWRKGEKYFAQKLLDYDPAVNNGNWQWVAGSGVDSQPYFRIFNPWSQSETHDKDAVYIKKWCPELETVPAKDIHNWFKTHTTYLQSGIKYNKPIVDYTERRKYVLDAYKKYLS